MDKRTFKRIKMLHEEGMSLKGAIVVLIDLCKSSDEAGEMIGELIETQPGADYDRGFVDAMKSAGCSTQGITKRKELRNYDPPT